MSSLQGVLTSAASNGRWWKLDWKWTNNTRAKHLVSKVHVCLSQGCVHRLVQQLHACVAPAFVHVFVCGVCKRWHSTHGVAIMLWWVVAVWWHGGHVSHIFFKVLVQVVYVSTVRWCAESAHKYMLSCYVLLVFPIYNTHLSHADRVLTTLYVRVDTACDVCIACDICMAPGHNVASLLH